MIFDAPLLLFLAPLVALALGFAAWLSRGRRIRLARRWSPALGRLARGRGGWAPIVLGVVATARQWSAWRDRDWGARRSRPRPAR